MRVEATAGTAAWTAARRGLLTASRMKDAAALLKTGKPSESRIRLMKELAAERLTGAAVDHYVTSAMQWGIDNQAGAISAYEALTGEIVGPELFVLHPKIEFFGATPDGLVGSDGLIEVKCPTTTTYVEWVLAGVVPEEHKLQMATQCACAGRQWVDFVAHDPRMPAGQTLFVRRYEPTADEIAHVEKVATDFLRELDDLVQRVACAEYA